MSKDIIKTGSTKSFPPIHNASFLRETKLQRGLGIAGRSKLRHRHRHVVACHKYQKASNMIRESAVRGSQGAEEPQQQRRSAQVQAEGIMARSHAGLGTNFTRFVNQFNWATSQLRSSWDPLGTHFRSQESCFLGTQDVALKGPNRVSTRQKLAQTSSDPLGTTVLSLSGPSST